MYYGSRLVDKGGSWRAFYAHVASAPMSSRLATGSWQKWYNGSWSQPGVGGKESNLVPVNASSSTGYTPPDKEYNPANTGTVSQQVAAGKTPPNSPLFVINIAYNAYLGSTLAHHRLSTSRASHHRKSMSPTISPARSGIWPATPAVAQRLVVPLVP